MSTPTPAPPHYILITQCLQNDFFLNPECGLALPDGAVSKLLLGGDGTTAPLRGPLTRAQLARSPLARFLDATVGSRTRGRGDGVLHLVNIRDWHLPGEAYDLERRQYGAHCEAGTWGARYLDGLGELLDPAEPEGGRNGLLQVHHVLSDTLFDFQHAEGGVPTPGERSALTGLLDRLLGDGRAETAHVVVIGVLTDIKIQLLLTGIRSRYGVRRLAVCDPLTAGRTLEHHLDALGFCERVLRVEIMTSLTATARFLGSRPEDTRRLPRAGPSPYASHSAYLRDRQSVLSYEDARLRDYRDQSSERLRRARLTIGFASRFLLGLGAGLLLISLLLSVLSVLFPHRFGWQIPALAGLLGAGQIVTLFFTRPVRSVQDALAEETVYRMILESRSLKIALARHHITTADALRRHGDPARRLAALQSQLEILEQIDTADFDRLKRLGITPDPPDPPETLNAPEPRQPRARRNGLRSRRRTARAPR
ncbi:hypothetical protein GCM10010387_57900 [Streptomyces inusitatus]|uniref:Uncharacterized protein n=1 Tax=Streptomyces inusitatus TaxID=68221 RepID=A0A918V1J5_9ACTN|nr:hypothetical protein [Streptomyces inusitatus]GGZ56310.1 hypothetical protein GCM10010387_57900 [Streptomyces inusitatus]